MGKLKVSEARICGIDFELVFTKDLGLNEGDVCGGIIEYNVEKPRIVVDTKQPVSFQRETLHHELLHGADRTSGGGKELPEETIDRVARAMYGIGRDNPLLMFWIFIVGQPRAILKRMLEALVEEDEK